MENSIEKEYCYVAVKYSSSHSNKVLFLSEMLNDVFSLLFRASILIKGINKFSELNFGITVILLTEIGFYGICDTQYNFSHPFLSFVLIIHHFWGPYLQGVSKLNIFIRTL